MTAANTSEISSRLRLKYDGTRAETRFRLSAERTSPFKSAGSSVQSTTGSRGVRINVRNAGCNMFRDSVQNTGYPLHSPVSPSLPHPCVTVCHHISIRLYTKKSSYFAKSRIINPIIYQVLQMIFEVEALIFVHSSYIY